MSSPYKTVLLIGASGNLGGAVLEAFMKSSYTPSVLSRQDSTSTFPEGVPVIRADYADIKSVTAAMKGQDVVISMVAPIAAGDQQIFIDAALATGVKRFFPAEFGPYTRKPEFMEINPYLMPIKTATVDFLKAHESQMSWTAVVNGAFFEWSMRDGFHGFDLTTKTATLIDDGVTDVTETTLSTVALALVKMLDHADETANQYVFISSFTCSQRDVLGVLEKLEPGQWTVKHVTSEEVIAMGRKRLESGDFDGIKDLTRAVSWGKQGLVDSRQNGLWDEKLGLPKGDLEQAMKDVLSAPPVLH